MNINDLERRLISEKRMAVIDDDEEKNYIEGDKVYYNGSFHNTLNVFGIYCNDNGDFQMFITDGERGVPHITRRFNTEEEACAVLYEYVSCCDIV